MPEEGEFAKEAPSSLLLRTNPYIRHGTETQRKKKRIRPPGI